MKLDKQSIIDAAFELLDEKGLDNFNLRDLAKKLSVSAAALYWHFDSKEELLGAMSGRIYQQAFAALSPEKDWQTSLLVFGRVFKEKLNQYSDAARLLATARGSTNDPKGYAKAIAAPLVRAGLSFDSALFYESNIISYTLGWSLHYQNDSIRTNLTAMMDFESSFETGLRAMIRGYTEEQAEAKLDNVRPANIA